MKLRVRSDSAAYRLDVMSYCLKHDMEFSITADLDAAVRETIDEIPEGKWQLVVRGEETFLLAETMSTLEALDHHNDRGRMEKAIGELKSGFGLDRLPCGQLMANAAYLQVCLIAYNLVQIFKSCALPESWRKFEIKNLRFRLLCRAARLVRHAGQVAMKLSGSFAHFEVFERARWAVLSPALTTSG